MKPDRHPGSRALRMLFAGVLFAVMTLICLGGTYSPWYLDDKTIRSLYDGVRLSLGMMLVGAMLCAGYTLTSAAISVQRKSAGTLSWRARDSEGDRPPREEGGSSRPPAGKPAPLQPRPGHHLVAAMGLPPGDAIYLLPKD